MRRSPRWRWLLRLAVALALLNGGLTFGNLWPTLAVVPRAEGSLDLAVLVLLLAGYVAWRGSPGRWGQLALTLLLLLLVLGRYADVSAPALYGRPLDLYWDAPQLPRVAEMLVAVSPGWQLALLLVGLLLLLGALYCLLGWAVRALLAGLAEPAARNWLGGGALLLIALFGAGQASSRLTSEHWFAVPVTPVYVRQLDLLMATLLHPAATELPASPDFAGMAPPPGQADVFIIFLESYGAVVFEQPSYPQTLAADYETLARTLAARGRGIVSAYFTSPTFGGKSWLAHASLLSGMRIADDATYQRLLRSQRDSLPRYFQRHGYRRVALLPGIRQAWPEGAFYGFERIYDATALAYPGPPFGWWVIPDQYSVAQLQQREVAIPDRAPLFVLFATLSSHAPFTPLPPYLPDWPQLRYETPVAAETSVWRDPGAAYCQAIRYNLHWLNGYLDGLAPTNALLVVLGDHQPPAAVSGTDASWQVPVHIISSDSALLTALQRVGFAPGWQPQRPPLGELHELPAVLLGVFTGLGS